VQKRWARMHAREAHVKRYTRFGFSGTTGMRWAIGRESH
jgi:hypothetical protein